MTKRSIRHGLSWILAGFLVILLFSAETMAQDKPQTNVSKNGLNFRQMIPDKLPRHIFGMKDWNVWTQCVVKGEDGRYHMFFGRWPKSTGHGGWCTHAEVAHAVSDKLLGPYTFRDVALPRRGSEFWDGESAYCPHVIKIAGKYYIYYTGNTGRNYWKKTPSGYLPSAKTSKWWVNRNNQRIGVAVADK